MSNLNISLNDSLESNDVLVDLGNIVGESLTATKRTTKNHLNKYLSYLNKLNNTIHIFCIYDKNVIPVDYWSHEILGKFGSYLIDIQKIKMYNTCLTYCRTLKIILTEDYPNLKSYDGTKQDEKWYTKLCNKLKEQYEKRCIEEGTNLVNPDPDMTKEDLEILCKLLLEKGTTQSMEARGAIVTQWYAVGRITECILLNLAHKSSRNTWSNIQQIY